MIEIIAMKFICFLYVNLQTYWRNIWLHAENEGKLQKIPRR